MTNCALIALVIALAVSHASAIGNGTRTRSSTYSRSTTEWDSDTMTLSDESTATIDTLSLSQTLTETLSLSSTHEFTSTESTSVTGTLSLSQSESAFTMTLSLSRGFFGATFTLSKSYSDDQTLSETATITDEGTVSESYSAGTLSQTDSETLSSTLTFTLTGTASMSSSGDATASRSGKTSTLSLSADPSSATETRTLVATDTLTESSTMTVSATQASPTDDATSTVSDTWSLSVSSSVSFTPTVTASLSASTSLSVSGMTDDVTRSVSSTAATPTATFSSVDTVTALLTSTATPSATFTDDLTATRSSSLSSSSTDSTSFTHTLSGDASASLGTETMTRTLVDSRTRTDPTATTTEDATASHSVSWPTASASASLVVTETLTPSASTTMTATASMGTRSISASTESTVSRSGASLSASPSSTISASSTESEEETTSASNSESLTGEPTGSESVTRTLISTPTATLTLTSTVSGSHSMDTMSASEGRTSTQSTSLTSTRGGSTTVGITVTQNTSTLSATDHESMTLSGSQSSSMSLTQSMTLSLSDDASSSSSVTLTLMASRTLTLIESQTSSLSDSASNEVTTTESLSTTASDSYSPSSDGPTLSTSATLTLSSTETFGTHTASRSDEETLTVLSDSPTSTHSATVTMTASATISAQKSSLTESSSVSFTTSPTGLATITGMLSRSLSVRTPTPTSTLVVTETVSDPTETSTLTAQGSESETASASLTTSLSASASDDRSQSRSTSVTGDTTVTFASASISATHTASSTSTFTTSLSDEHSKSLSDASSTLTASQPTLRITSTRTLHQTESLTASLTGTPSIDSATLTISRMESRSGTSTLSALTDDVTVSGSEGSGTPTYSSTASVTGDKSASRSATFTHDETASVATGTLSDSDATPTETGSLLDTVTRMMSASESVSETTTLSITEDQSGSLTVPTWSTTHALTETVHRVSKTERITVSASGSAVTQSTTQSQTDEDTVSLATESLSESPTAATATRDETGSMTAPTLTLTNTLLSSATPSVSATSMQTMSESAATSSVSPSRSRSHRSLSLTDLWTATRTVSDSSERTATARTLSLTASISRSGGSSTKTRSAIVSGSTTTTISVTDDQTLSWESRSASTTDDTTISASPRTFSASVSGSLTLRLTQTRTVAATLSPSLTFTDDTSASRSVSSSGGSVTMSVTDGDTQSRSPTETRTLAHTESFTISSTEDRTRSRSVTATASESASRTLIPSDSATLLASETLTDSPSSTWSESEQLTATQSRSPSRSEGSASATDGATMSVTHTVSSSASMGSITATATERLTVTNGTPSEDTTVTETNSQRLTKSDWSYSLSLTQSEDETWTTSESATRSVELTVTPQASPSRSASPSHRSATPSDEQTATTTVSESSSGEATSTETETHSRGSESLSSTEEASSSATSTLTSTVSATATESVGDNSTTRSASNDVTVTLSSATTETPTLASTLSPSNSESGELTYTASAGSATQDATVSFTRTLSVTSSPSAATSTLAQSDTLSKQVAFTTVANLLRPASIRSASGGTVEVGQALVLQLSFVPPFATGDALYLVPSGGSLSGSPCALRVLDTSAVAMRHMGRVGATPQNWTSSLSRIGTFDLCFLRAAATSWHVIPIVNTPSVICEPHLLGSDMFHTRYGATGSSVVIDVPVIGGLPSDSVMLIPLGTDAPSTTGLCQFTSDSIIGVTTSVGASSITATLQVSTAGHYVVCYRGYPNAAFRLVFRFVTISSRVTAAVLTPSVLGTSTTYLANEWIAVNIVGSGLATFDRVFVVNGSLAASCTQPTSQIATVRGARLVVARSRGTGLTALPLRFVVDAPSAPAGFHLCYRGNFSSSSVHLASFAVTSIRATTVVPSNVTVVAGSAIHFTFAGPLLNPSFDTAHLCLAVVARCGPCNLGTIAMTPHVLLPSSVRWKVTVEPSLAALFAATPGATASVCYISNTTHRDTSVPVASVAVARWANRDSPLPQLEVGVPLRIAVRGFLLEPLEATSAAVFLVRLNGSCDAGARRDSVPAHIATASVESVTNSVLVTAFVATSLKFCLAVVDLSMPEAAPSFVESEALHVNSVAPVTFSPQEFTVNVSVAVTFGPGGGTSFNFLLSNDTVTPCSSDGPPLFVVDGVVNSSALLVRFIAAPVRSATLCFAPASSPSSRIPIPAARATVRSALRQFVVSGCSPTSEPRPTCVTQVGESVTLTLVVTGGGSAQLANMVGLCARDAGNGSLTLSVAARLVSSSIVAVSGGWGGSVNVTTETYVTSSLSTAAFAPCVSLVDSETGLLTAPTGTDVAFATILASAAMVPRSPHHVRAVSDPRLAEEYFTLTSTANGDVTPAISSVILVPASSPVCTGTSPLAIRLQRIADPLDSRESRITTWRADATTLRRGNFSVCFTSSVAPSHWFSLQAGANHTITGSVAAGRTYSTVEALGTLYSGCSSQFAQFDTFAYDADSDAAFVVRAAAGCSASLSERLPLTNRVSVTPGGAGSQLRNVTFTLPRLELPGAYDLCVAIQHDGAPTRVLGFAVLPPVVISGGSVTLKCTDTSGSALYKAHVLPKGSTSRLLLSESTSPTLTLPATPLVEADIVVEEYAVDLNNGGALTLRSTRTGSANATSLTATVTERRHFCSSFPQKLQTSGTDATQQQIALSEGLIHLLNFDAYRCGDLVKAGTVPSSRDATAIVAAVQALIRGNPTGVGDAALTLDTMAGVVTGSYNSATLTQGAIESLLAATDLEIVRSIATPEVQNEHATAQLGMINTFVQYLQGSGDATSNGGSQTTAVKVVERLDVIGKVLCDTQSAATQSYAHPSINFTVARASSTDTLQIGPSVRARPQTSATGSPASDRSCFVLFALDRNILPQRAAAASSTRRRGASDVPTPLPDLNLPTMGLIAPASLARLSVQMRHLAPRVDTLQAFRFYPDDPARPFTSGGAWFLDDYAYSYDAVAGLVAINVTALSDTGGVVILTGRADLVVPDPLAPLRASATDRFITFMAYVAAAIAGFQVLGTVAGFVADAQHRKRLSRDAAAVADNGLGGGGGGAVFNAEEALGDTPIAHLHRLLVLAVEVPVARHFHASRRPTAAPQQFVSTVAKVNAVAAHFMAIALAAYVVLDESEAQALPNFGHEVVAPAIAVALIAQPFSAIARAALLRHTRDSVGIIASVLSATAAVIGFVVAGAGVSAIAAAAAGIVGFAAAFAALRHTWRLYSYENVNGALRALGLLALLALEVLVVVLVFALPYFTRRIAICRNRPFMPRFDAYLAWAVVAGAAVADALVIEPFKAVVLSRAAAHAFDAAADRQIRKARARKARHIAADGEDSDFTHDDGSEPHAAIGVAPSATTPSAELSGARRTPRRAPPTASSVPYSAGRGQRKALPADVEELADPYDDDDDDEDDDASEIDVLSNSSLFSELPAFNDALRSAATTPGDGGGGGDFEEPLPRSPARGSAPSVPAPPILRSVSRVPTSRQHSIANPLGDGALWMRDSPQRRVPTFDPGDLHAVRSTRFAASTEPFN